MTGVGAGRSLEMRSGVSSGGASEAMASWPAPVGAGMNRGSGRCGLAVEEVFDEFFERILHEGQSFVLQHAAPDVGLGEEKGRKRDLVAIFGQGMVFQVAVRMVRDFGGVAGKQALIEAFDGCQGRRIAQDDVEKGEPLDMAADNHQANGERRRKDQADRSPQPRPERCGQDDRDR